MLLNIFRRSIFAALFLLPLCVFGQMPNIGLLANINPGTTGSSPSNMTKLGSTIIFSATDAANGGELWKSDGTIAGTTLIKDIRSGTSSSSPSNFVVMGSFVYFTANDGVVGGALWRTDGTTNGTTLVKDVNTTSTSSSASINNLMATATKLYFRGNDGTNGEEPWISDGTANGTSMLKNIAPTSASSSGSGIFGTFEFVEFNGFVYFTADDLNNSFQQNSELWRTNGTTSGTVLFKDNYTFGGGGPGNYVNAGSYLFFTSDNQSNTGLEPWKTDGTVGGTVMIKDIFNFANVGSITGDVPTAFMNGFVYFVAVNVYEPSPPPGVSFYINAELYRTDGTSANTTMVKEINTNTTSGLSDANPSNFFVFNNKLYFSATDGTNGIEPWVTDGTAANTVILKNIDAVGNSSPRNFSMFNNFVYFSADDNATNDRELWRTDGTGDNTLLVKDINPGTAGGSPTNLVALDANHALFGATHIVSGSELFIIGGFKTELTTGANGISTPPGTGSASTTIDIGVKSGGSSTFTFTPNSTFSVQSVTVNSVGAGTPSSYTFNNVTSNQTLSVAFGTGPAPCTPPTAATSATSDVNNFCSNAGGNISLSAVGGSGTTLNWYTSSCGGTLVGSGTPLVLAKPIVTTTYFARWETTDCTPSTCASVTVTVGDNTAPSITCPANTAAQAGSNCTATLAAYTAVATASDNCTTNPTKTQSPVAGTVITGSQIVTLTATDAANNSATCSFTVTVADQTSPTITCPANATVQAGSNCTATLAVYTAVATASDNCTTNPAKTQSPVAGTVITGSQIVTLTATDAANNSATCSFTVSVADQTAPTITCPANTTVQAGANCTATLAAYIAAATASDNCTTNPTKTQSPVAGTVIIGSQIVTLTATDAANNTATCSFTVTVADQTSPTITCPANATVQAGANCTATLAAYIAAATASDNCTTNPTKTQSPVAGTVISGSQIVTLTATDAANNSATCSFTVTVVDQTAPTITCPANTTVQAGANCTATLATYTATATASDNCTTNPAKTQSPVAGTVITGSQIVTLTATDAANNTATCSFTVTVADQTPPTVVCKPFTANLSAAGTAIITTANLFQSGADNCGTVNQASITPNSLTCANLGANTVTLTVNDGNGNTATCSAVVTVVDNTPPDVVCKPFTANLSAAGTTSITIANVFQSGADNCGTVNQVSVTLNSFTCSNLGANSVTLTVNDGNGNTATCSAVVTVVDNIAPSVVCKPFTANLSTAGSAIITTANVFQSGADNCGTVNQVSVTPNALTCANLGANTLTLTVNDGNGNTATCTAVVTVVDNIAPTVVCKPFSTNLVGGATVTIPASSVFQSGADNCGTVNNVSVTPNTFSCANVGANTVTLTVNDGNGNTATCLATVTIADGEAPIALCQNVSKFITNTGVVTLTAAEVNNGSNDACTSVANLSLSQTSFNCSNVGTNTVILTVTDAGNNTATCSATVTISIPVNSAGTCAPPAIIPDPSVVGNTVTFNWLNGCYEKYRVQYRKTIPASATWTTKLVNAPTNSTSALMTSSGIYRWGLVATCAGISQYSTLTAGNNYVIAGPTPLQANMSNFVDATVWPNPAKKMIHIGINSSKSGTCVVRMFDQLGRTTYSTSFFADGLTENQFSVEGMSDGLYFVQILMAGQDPITKSIIVQR